VPTGASVAIPHFTKQLDYEIEVGVIIGKTAFRVAREEALDYVAGLTILMTFPPVTSRREH
jgi:2-keto-4-pentenoate hydratase/2-oxohepta-3-ene-1,7-dioic acid hydratase in catechol pathway